MWKRDRKVYSIKKSLQAIEFHMQFRVAKQSSIKKHRKGAANSRLPSRKKTLKSFVFVTGEINPGTLFSPSISPSNSGDTPVGEDMEGLPKIQELEEDQFSLYIEEEDVEGSTRTALLAQRLEDPAADSWDEDSLHKVEEDRLRLSRFKAVRIVPETDPELNRNSSAFQFTMDDRLSSLAKSHGE